MTIQELIELLEGYNQNKQVYLEIADEGNHLYDIYGIDTDENGCTRIIGH